MTPTSGFSRRTSCLIFLIATLVFAWTGCDEPSATVVDKVPPPPPERPRSNEDIVFTLEANTAKLDQALWSNSVQVVARIVDENKKDHAYNLEGSLLYSQPRNLLIKLRPGVGGEVMQIGSNRDEFWAWVEPEINRMWWGRYEHANKPCAQRVLVRPDELVAALGIGLPKTEGTDLIGPIRRSGKKFDILQYVRLTDEGLPEPVQEYWISRKAPYLVELVAFFDQFGRKAMTASLTDYQPAYEDGPLLAHKVSVFWPIEGSKLSLAVRRYRAIDSTKLKDSAFARPTDSPPLPASVAQNILRIDADCDSFDSGWNDFGTDAVLPTGIAGDDVEIDDSQEASITANEPTEAEDD